MNGAGNPVARGGVLGNLFNTLFGTDITGVTLVSVNFLGDHRLMQDNTSARSDALHRWDVAGSRVPSSTPQWEPGASRNAPASITRDKQVNLELVFQVNPNDASETDATLTGSSGAGGPLTFDAQTYKFKGGPIPASSADPTPSTTSKEKLPHLVKKLTPTIGWLIGLKKLNINIGSSGPHIIYVTLNTPQKAPGRESGITVNRMDKAVELVDSIGSDDSHAIAAALQAKFPSYTLTPDPAVPSIYNHPTYFNNTAGAWAAADYISNVAECQAIIRFVRAIMMQVGCDGVMAIVVVSADPFNSAAVKEEDWDAGGGGLSGLTKVINGRNCIASLVDANPGSVGSVFKFGTIGLNNFEACLKLTAGGRTKYYGGGAGDYDTKEQVIYAFYALCWVSFGVSSTGDQTVRIEEIVKRYRDASGNVVP